MACKNCFSARELLDGTNIKDATCDKKLSLFNRMLRAFYEDTADLTENHFSEGISLNCGLNTIQTQYPITGIIGFFGEGCGDCFIPIDNCVECKRGEYKNMSRVLLTEGGYYLGKMQYKMNTDCNNEVYVNVPKEIHNSFIYYKRGAKQIVSINDEICMPDSLRTGFEYYIEAMYALKDDELNRYSVMMGKYNEWIKKRKENQLGTLLDISINHPNQ